MSGKGWRADTDSGGRPHSQDEGEGEEFHRILVSTPRINTLSDWSLRRGAPTKKNWGWGMGAPRLSEPIRQGVYSGGGNKYSDGVAILACF